MGVGFAVDIKKLDVCFGGFTPMALSDGIASQEQVALAEERMRERRAFLERLAVLEAARASEEREAADANGNVWRYVVLDDAEVRIVSCVQAAVDLMIPAELEGKPVVALADDACAYLADVEHITCPDSLFSIGFCAFRGCKNLRSMVFPATLASFDSDWLRSCSKLEHLVLPGMLPKLDARVFDTPHLRSLVIGAGTMEIVPGTFAKSVLERIEVDETNPFLACDGRALYSKDGSVMVALALPCASYRVAGGCKAIAKKAFSNFAAVECIEVPAGLEVLDEFAFANTGIHCFKAPESLRVIGEKAFFHCAKLRDVTLNEGLERIDRNAFSGTSLVELRLPATIEAIANPIAANTALTYAGPDATFSIAPGAKHLLLDEGGALYGRAGDDLRLLRMMDPAVRTYRVQPGATIIGEGAFEKHTSLVEVVLPDGLREIAAKAFKGCTALECVNVPESVTSVGAEAFLDTALRTISIPERLDDIGPNALVTYGAHHGERPTLHNVEVDARNERFFRVPGLLLERKVDGAARVVLCTGDVDAVHIPPEVNEIAPYALNGVRGVRELYLSDRIQDVGMRGLAVEGLLDLIHIDLDKPVGSHTFFELRFPQTDRGAQQMMLALSVPAYVDVAALFEHYDSAIVNASSFDPVNGGRLDIYEQSTRIVERMLDPVYMTPVHRAMCDRMLRDEIEDVCVALAKHDDRRTVDALVELRYLNADNLYRVIDRVGAVQDAAMTNYLLEIKRERFGQRAIDFDL